MVLGRAVDAVEGLGKDAGGRRLSCTPHSRKQIGLRNPVCLDGVPEGLDDGPLADHFLKGLRPVSTGENFV